ncbi:hypothetical protein HanLR1_Chr11g0405691 [Helianthus annuus]|nr:hypothetical protein HanLR1_Chr11g0405691 [Helianthus annuus]
MVYSRNFQNLYHLNLVDLHNDHRSSDTAAPTTTSTAGTATTTRKSMITKRGFMPWLITDLTNH